MSLAQGRVDLQDRDTNPHASLCQEGYRPAETCHQSCGCGVATHLSNPHQALGNPILPEQRDPQGTQTGVL